MEIGSLEIVGYQDQNVPNTFIRQSHPAKHLGIVLPGYRYSADMPPLHYAGRVLFEQGADVLSVDYAYYRSNFNQQSQSEQDKWMSSDVLAACEVVLSRRPYEKITLVGKSLGTLAMGRLLADSRFQTATCVWLTPLLTVPWLCSRIEEVHPRSIFIIGTADQFYKPDILKQLESITHGHAVVIEGADHSLEIHDSIPKSLMALNQIVQALQEFLKEA